MFCKKGCRRAGFLDFYSRQDDRKLLFEELPVW